MISLMDAALPLDQMTVEEKLKAMEAIWRSLSKHEDQVPVPDWHKQVLDERQRQIDAGEATFVSLEEMKERVRKRTGWRFKSSTRPKRTLSEGFWFYERQQHGLGAYFLLSIYADLHALEEPA